jgi:DNA recombination-dependent growth factor C
LGEKLEKKKRKKREKLEKKEKIKRKLIKKTFKIKISLNNIIWYTMNVIGVDTAIQIKVK